jgi:hypothetical protein
MNKITQCLSLKQLLYQAHKKRKLINNDTLALLTIPSISGVFETFRNILISHGIEVSQSTFQPGEYLVTWPEKKKFTACKSIW